MEKSMNSKMEERRKPRRLKKTSQPNSISSILLDQKESRKLVLRESSRKKVSQSTEVYSLLAM